MCTVHRRAFSRLPALSAERYQTFVGPSPEWSLGASSLTVLPFVQVAPPSSENCVESDPRTAPVVRRLEMQRHGLAEPELAGLGEPSSSAAGSRSCR